MQIIRNHIILLIANDAVIILDERVNLFIDLINYLRSFQKYINHSILWLISPCSSASVSPIILEGKISAREGST
jgi:hypothetical protein